MNVNATDDDSLNEFISQYIHTKILTLQNDVPEICKGEKCTVGIDEAGRGPVLGPMVYGVCYYPTNRANDFTSLGCADSKTLSEAKREDIFGAIRACDDYIGWAVDIISPNYISNCMLRRDKYSLNEIALDSTVSLISTIIEKGVLVSEIYVDTVGPPDKHQEKLLKYFPNCKITVAKKADSLYPVVSAASICAKVFRDRVINKWNFPESIGMKNSQYGSGYPNDPETKQFLVERLNKIFGFPNIVRFSWSTANKILENSAIPVEWDDEEVDESMGIKSFFRQKTGNTEKHEMKHSFFLDNFLCNADSF